MNSRTFDEQASIIEKGLKNQEISIYDLQQLLLASENLESDVSSPSESYRHLYKQLYKDIINANSTENQRITRLAVSIAILRSENKYGIWGYIPRFVRDEHHRKNPALMRGLRCDGGFLKKDIQNELKLALKVAIHASQIEKFYFFVNKFDVNEMASFRDIILSSTHITELGISFFDADEENLNRVDELLSMIAGSKITSLFINASDAENLATGTVDYQCLSKWDARRLNHLCAILKHLESLNLTKNLIGEMTIEKLRPLFLNISTLSTLNLTQNHLHLWNSQPEKWPEFFHAIESSSIKNLSLARNDLSSWTNEEVMAFSRAIKNSQIENLDLNECGLEKWTPQQLIIFCDAIKDSKVNTLNMESRYRGVRWEIQKLSEPQLEILFDAFNDTTIAIEASYPELRDHPAVKMAIRNCGLRNICNKLEDESYRYMKGLHDLEDIIETDESHDPFLTHYDVDEIPYFFKSTHEVIETLEASKKLLSEWRVLPLPRACKEGCERLQSAIINFIDTIFAYEFLIPELLCALPAAQYKTREMYGKYFDYTYVTQCALGESKESALLHAMQFCLDAENHPVTFATHEQRMFDTYLQAACGIKDRFDLVVTMEQRHDLLQYYLLRMLAEKLPRLISDNKLSQQILDGLKDELKTLPKISDLAQLDANTSKKLADLFDKAQKKLTRANVPLSTISQNDNFKMAWGYSTMIINHAKENEINLKKIYAEAINAKMPISSFLTALPTCLNDSHELKFYSAEQQKIFDSFLLKVCRLDSINDNQDLNNVDRLSLLRYLVVTTLNKKPASTQTFLASEKPLQVTSVSDLAKETDKLSEMEQKIHKKLSQSSSGIPAEWQPVFKCILNLHKVAENNPQTDQSQGIRPM